MNKYQLLREKLLRDYKAALSITLENAPVSKDEFRDITKNTIPFIYPSQSIKLANDLGVTKSTVSKWLNDAAMPSAPTRKEVVATLIRKIEQQLEKPKSP